MVKDFSYGKIVSVNHFYLVIDKTNGSIEESNGYRSLRLVSNDESKDTVKNNENIWDKIKDIFRSTTNKS